MHGAAKREDRHPGLAVRAATRPIADRVTL
jgi:hypothetical protein